MSYVVFDLEWNQSPGGKKYSNRRLPFEIIEIGAVKMNEDREVTDTFHRLIRPQVYNWIHDSIHDVIHVDYKDLETGVPFEQAADEFLNWCGPACDFFTWGDQDLMELQRNLKYYGMLERLPGPLIFYDVQKIFGLCVDRNLSMRRSLEHAADWFKIPRSRVFHRALSDAEYTAEVLKCLDMDQVKKFCSLDVYQNPKNKKEEIYLRGPDYERYISREFKKREDVIRDREVSCTRCPVCRKLARKRLRWFMNHSRAYECVSECRVHGWIKGRVRIRHTEEKRYFADKIMTMITEEQAGEIRQKKDALRQKRQNRASRLRGAENK